jgi:addiction module RelE/StbE family toxin
MAQIKWSAQSLKDIENICSYIENVSFHYAQQQAKAIYAKAEQLQSHPLSGRPVPELNIHSIRQLLCGSYRIIYEVGSEDDLTILTVHHQSRLFENNPVFKDKKE